jgi:hypothetical protein
MPTRGKTTFQKRQKEMARKDKQQRKAERRAQRKLDSENPDRAAFQEVESTTELDRESEPREI